MADRPAIHHLVIMSIRAGRCGGGGCGARLLLGFNGVDDGRQIKPDLHEYRDQMLHVTKVDGQHGPDDADPKGDADNAKE